MKKIHLKTFAEKNPKNHFHDVLRNSEKNDKILDGLVARTLRHNDTIISTYEGVNT